MHRFSTAAAEAGFIMTGKALLVSHPLIIVHIPDLVRLMTVDACWEEMRLLLPQFTFDHLHMDLLDLLVTNCTGFGNVFSCNGG